MSNLNKQLDSITDENLVIIAKKILDKLCETGGNSFTMSVPEQVYDTDTIFNELIKRFDKKIRGGECDECGSTDILIKTKQNEHLCKICYKEYLVSNDLDENENEIKRCLYCGEEIEIGYYCSRRCKVADMND